jgi:hypothetical protein
VTDPVYGDHPFDPTEAWNQSMVGVLAKDPEWKAWRNVLATMVRELLESQWLGMWRRDVMTAEGQQLVDLGEMFIYPQPVGWDTERYREVLAAIMAASLSYPTCPVVANLARALVDEDQSQTLGYKEELPCAARFTYNETSEDDAIAYLAALERVRPPGTRFQVVAHPGGGGSPFTIGTSTIGGTDTLAELFEL